MNSLKKVDRLIKELNLKPTSRIERSRQLLEQAQKVFEAGQHHLLFRGEVISCLPRGLRNWFIEVGLLSTDQY